MKVIKLERPFPNENYEYCYIVADSLERAMELFREHYKNYTPPHVEVYRRKYWFPMAWRKGVEP